MKHHDQVIYSVLHQTKPYNYIDLCTKYRNQHQRKFKSRKKKTLTEIYLKSIHFGKTV